MYTKFVLQTKRFYITDCTYGYVKSSKGAVTTSPPFFKQSDVNNNNNINPKGLLLGNSQEHNFYLFLFFTCHYFCEVFSFLKTENLVLSWSICRVLVYDRYSDYRLTSIIGSSSSILSSLQLSN